MEGASVISEPKHSCVILRSFTKSSQGIVRQFFTLRQFISTNVFNHFNTMLNRGDELMHVLNLPIGVQASLLQT